MSNIVIVKPGASWPDGTSDYREFLALPGYCLLGWRVFIDPGIKDIALKVFWKPEKGGFPLWDYKSLKFFKNKAAKNYDGYEPPQNRVSWGRLLGQLHRNNSIESVIVEPNTLFLQGY